MLELPLLAQQRRPREVKTPLAPLLQLPVERVEKLLGRPVVRDPRRRRRWKDLRELVDPFDERLEARFLDLREEIVISAQAGRVADLRLTQDTAKPGFLPGNCTPAATLAYSAPVSGFTQ
jgi:hypothetical protein